MAVRSCNGSVDQYCSGAIFCGYGFLYCSGVRHQRGGHLRSVTLVAAPGETPEKAGGWLPSGKRIGFRSFACKIIFMITEIFDETNFSLFIMSDIGIFPDHTDQCLRRGHMAGLRADPGGRRHRNGRRHGNGPLRKEHPHCLLPGQYHEDHDSPGGD